MDKRMIKSILWGACSLVGFFITDKLYEVAVDYIEKESES